jgi:mercuric ion binding protein
MRKIIFSCLLFFLATCFAFSQNPRKMKTVIKTSAECEFCKKNIEKNLSKVKGIRKVNCDYQKHEISLVYNSKKISLDEIKKQIILIGFDADDQKANFDKFNKINHKK